MLTTTLYPPASPSVTPANINPACVPPLTGAPSLYHWYSGAVPYACTLNTAVLPAWLVRLTGCAVITGSITVNTAGGVLVTTPATLLTTTV